MANFRDEILKLVNPAPTFQDPEDVADDDTTAKLASKDTDDAPDDFLPSKLRQKAAVILSDSDGKYAGQRTSRQHLEDDISDGIFSDDQGDNEEVDDGSDDIDDNDDDDAESEEESEDEISDFNKKFSQIETKEFSFQDDGDFSKYADDDEDMNDDDEDDDDDGYNDDSDDLQQKAITKSPNAKKSKIGDDDDDESDDDEEGDDDDADDDDVDESEDEGIQKFSGSASEDVAKGQAAKQQLGVWDTLLEGRIKLQKAVSLINQLPQTDMWTQYTEESEDFTHEANKTEEVLKHLLQSLVHLQDLMLFQNKETRVMASGLGTDSSVKTTPADNDDDDDEEIPSDSDEEVSPEPRPVSRTQAPPGKRKLKIDDYPGFMKKRHEDFSTYRNATIQKWYDKTRLATGKVKGKSFSAFDQSALAQINQILGDKERLVRRSQLKRSVYRVLGTLPRHDQPEVLPTDDQQPEAVSQSNEHLKDFDEEIFDDDDFYHQMLRELIEKKTADVSDPVALSRQWLEIQKLRSKNKKKVDTKASKGRKVRYDVHKKLVNFMAPVDSCEWTHEARDDLFKSLFGKSISSSV